MKPQGILVRIAASVFFLVSPLSAEERFKADSESARAGVAEYGVVRSSRTAFEVTVRDAAKATMATLGVQLATADGHVLTFERGSTRLRVVLDLPAGKISVTDLVTRETGSRTIDMAHHKLIREGNQEVFDKNEHDIDFAMRSFDQTLINLGLGEYRQDTRLHGGKAPSVTTPAAPSAQGPGGGVAPPQNQYNPGDNSDGGCTPACQGAIIDPGYYEVATSRSLCCYRATSDTNEACSNRYCLGCCSILGCDYICGAGQYLCGCSVEGQACSEPSFC